MKRILVVITVIAGICNGQASDRLISDFLAQANIQGDNVYSAYMAAQISFNPAWGQNERILFCDSRWRLQQNREGTYTLEGSSLTYGDPNKPYHQGDTFTLSQIQYLVTVYEAATRAWMAAGHIPNSTAGHINYLDSIQQVCARISGSTTQLEKDLLAGFTEFENEIRLGAYIAANPEAQEPLIEAVMQESEYTRQVFGSLPNGIHNIGATCFMNAIFQALAAILRQLGHPPLKGPAGVILNELFREIQSPYKHIIAPRKYYQALLPQYLKSFSLRFDPKTGPNIVANLASLVSQRWGSSQDAQEFLLELLNVLDLSEIEWYDQTIYKSAKDAAPGEGEIEALIKAYPNSLNATSLTIRENFWGSLHSVCQCSACSYISTNPTESFLSLGLSISDPQGNHYKTIEDCLGASVLPHRDRYDPNNLWICPECQGRVMPIRSIHIEHFPEVLILHIKRSSYDYSRHVVVEDTYPITFEEVLHYGNKPYDLQAVIHHWPNHYTTSTRTASGGWAHSSDSDVILIPAPLQDDGALRSVALLVYTQEQEMPSQRQWLALFQKTGS
ncbi:MAG: ubiquitin carboxyl-terminal hydrolase [Holosporales bacterium]|jgi:ubiquitin C-terminal hydrolase|nr:ubiquitin carboxyl-terminal hydrolase [Holosporales bacterium]